MKKLILLAVIATLFPQIASAGMYDGMYGNDNKNTGIYGNGSQSGNAPVYIITPPPAPTMPAPSIGQASEGYQRYMPGNGNNAPVNRVCYRAGNALICN